jgi:hypothetical protein
VAHSSTTTQLHWYCLADFTNCAGRLNVLANVVCKPMAQIFSDFSSRSPTITPKPLTFFGCFAIV